MALGTTVTANSARNPPVRANFRAGWVVADLLRFERAVALPCGMPVIDPALLSDRAFMRGPGAAFFYVANLSFYL